jgi:hypothetical protein
MKPTLAFWLEPGLEPIVHLGSADGHDTTLCGYALEGNPGESDAQAVETTKPQKITCGRCSAIVRGCRTVSRNHVA